MDKHKYADKVAIVTQTLYRDNSEVEQIRAGLAKSLFEKAINYGYLVVVIDGGSSEKILKGFRKKGVILESHEQKGKKFGPGRRKGIKIAYDLGKEVIVWIEAEKDELIAELEKIVEPIITGEADLVIPARKSLNSYLGYQQLLERFGNRFFKLLTGKNLDMWFGPRAFNRGVAKYFLSYSGEYGDLWESIFIPVLDAIHKSKKVKSTEVDYSYPRSQAEVEKNPEFYVKRVLQLNNIIPALGDYWKKLNL